MNLWETGLTRQWTKIQLPQASACFDERSRKRTAKQSSIKLVDLTSAFFVLASGVTIASFTFAAEFVNNFMRKWPILSLFHFNSLQGSQFKI